MKRVPVETFFEYFGCMPDPRMDRTKDHKLLDIIVVAICGAICGADGWVAMEEFGKSTLSWFKQFLDLPNGIPSHDTFGRVFSLLETEMFAVCFVNCTSGVASLTCGEVIATDSKTLRRSFDTASSKGAIHMVSAWACENGLVLGQVKTAEKSNEITAIPRLLDMLDISGCIVTIDAMGCQKTIAKKIVDRGGDYIFSLKGNQSMLNDDVRDFFRFAEEEGFKDIPHDYAGTMALVHHSGQCGGLFSSRGGERRGDSEGDSRCRSIGQVLCFQRSSRSCSRSFPMERTDPDP